ncbi:FIG006542: Phosphoesterase [Halanaerobium saccharolyticum subsp. saccharolyticum DSM 6643]|uniref:FIG006542: Phosphoesterase n=1 Tax=Halanaerobium saccharolyticum subsp. saccharolyticum DSM 6643 TaxID=1293054 RepID=M5DZG4_9FIRM|nr:TIGR00282 family metallophosphoesterase [Halanaerobium saccharolyticum]CCU79180.1 FIG006542: Phosphoesterase [Halanaerobium saccharolyticum subsp. saccharolyticum DSM 6643]
MNILFIGDIVGRAGRRAVRIFLDEIIEEHNIDFVISNGENSAGGFGITKKVAEELYDYGIDFFTMGNHTWDNRDIFNFIDDDPNLIRPLNYPENNPGRGWQTLKINSKNVTIVNLIGQIYMQNNDSPYHKFMELYPEIKDSDIILVDFHAEATGEKMAFARAVDGMVTAVIGTHTHVQTNDAQIFPEGTAYITDAGLTGAIDSILGMKPDKMIEKMKTSLPVSYDVGTGNVKIEGVIVKTDDQNNSVQQIMEIKKNNL